MELPWLRRCNSTVGRSFGFAAVALALLVGSGPGERPLGLEGPERQAKYLVGFVSKQDGARLTPIGETLREIGPRSKNLGFVDAWAVSPQDDVVAIAAHPSSRSFADSLRFVALRNLRLLPRTVTLGGPVWTLLWRNPHRIVALVGDCCSPESTIVVVDPGARRVLSRETVGGAISALERDGGTLALLSTPARAIGPAQLVVVDSVGTIRRVELTRIQAGTSWPADTSAPPLGTQRIPAVAVDDAGGHVYVVFPDGLGADVSLGTLDVSYHQVATRSLGARLSAWLQPAAQAKGINGVAWDGTWLGNGYMAITGEEQHATLDANNRETMSGNPAGLAIIDVRDWTIRMIDRGAGQVIVADDLLLATGRTWGTSDQRQTGMGLAAYGADTGKRFHLFAGSAAWIHAVWGGRAYVRGLGGATSVVELATGRVVEQRKGELPMPLLQDFHF
jgi:hypothetical protein